MSSAKRRKVDGDVPSGLKEKKKEAPVANPAPSSPPREPEEPEQQKEEAAPKSFKDLVLSAPPRDAQNLRTAVPSYRLVMPLSLETTVSQT
jgi:hypothetical protein